MTDTTTARIGPYDVISVLGRGGMGTVYRVRNGAGHDVALKLLATVTDSDPLARLRFQREFRILSSLDHPNLVKVLDSGEHEGRPWYTMEWLVGRTLSEALPADDRLSHIVRHGLDIARGLDYIHQSGIIHRDLKPANIMVLDSGSLKLTDFGLAREIVPDVPVSRSNTMVGTIQYMAPEQIVSGPVDARTDLYSFGVLLYELVTGRLPVSTGDWMASIQQILEETPDAPGGPLNDLIMRLLEKAPENRFQTGLEVVAALEKVAQDLGIPQHRLVPAVPTLRPQLLSPPLLGREEASLRLLDALDRARQGEAQVVTLAGPPGMGSTRLALEVVRQARRQGFQVFAEALAPGRERSYQTLIPWLHWLALPEAGWTMEDVARHVRTHFMRPTLALLDPLQEADKDSLTLLGYLASDLLAAPGVPFFLLLTPCPATLPGQAVDLRPLTADEGTRLLQGALGGMTDRPDWLERLVGLAGGNPATLLGRLRALMEEGTLRRTDGRWECRTEDIPSQDHAPVRLDELSPDTLDTLRRLALLGGQASFRRLQSSSPLGETVLMACLDSLLERRLVASDGHAGLACDPQAMQEVWTGLEETRQQSLHRDIAMGLERSEPEAGLLIARHYCEGGLPERATAPYQRALKEALAQGATERATTVARELARAMEGHEATAEARLMVLDGLLAGDEAEAAERLARRWVESATEPLSRAGYLRRLGEACQGLDRHEEALDIFCRGLGSLGLVPGMGPDQKVRGLRRLVLRTLPLMVRLYSGRGVPDVPSVELSPAHAEAIELFLHLPETYEYLPQRPPVSFLAATNLQMVDLWRARPSARLLARVYGSLCMAAAMRRWSSYDRICQQAQRLCSVLPDKDAAQLTFIRGITAWRRWDLPGAARCLRESYLTAQQKSQSVHGQVFWVAICGLFLGELEEARKMAAQMGAKARWLGLDRYAQLWEGLESLLEGQVPKPPASTDSSHLAGVARFLAALAAWTGGDPKAAIPLLELNLRLYPSLTIYHFQGWDAPLLSLCTGAKWQVPRDAVAPADRRTGLQHFIAGRRAQAIAWFNAQGWCFWQAAVELTNQPHSLRDVLDRAQQLSCKESRP